MIAILLAVVLGAALGDARPAVMPAATAGHRVAAAQDPSPQGFAQIANVVEHKGMLYFGSIGESAIGRMPMTVPR